MLNRYAGTCRCGTYVYPGKGAYVAGKVTCSEHAPAGAMVPPDPSPPPAGMHEVEMHITGDLHGCDAALETLRLSPLTNVMTAQRATPEPGRVEVTARVRFYGERWQAEEDWEARP
ncbi:MAG: hypothetical protein JO362_22145 [Streptomycetaceae bacterium]|nr:hypothetical protein [Kutzneria sp.]MBV9026428.1 hypothetical protein [Streptomycetaceae bacterium]